MNSDANLYPLQKSFGGFYCTEFFQMEKRGKKPALPTLNIKREHRGKWFTVFPSFCSQVCGFFGYFLSLIFLDVLLNFIGLFFAQLVSYTYFSFYLPWFWYFLFNRKTTMAMTTTKTTTAMQSPIIMIKVSLLVEVFVAEK